MGAAKSKLEKAEEDLIRWGIDWWRRTEESEGTTPHDVCFDSFNVPLNDVDGTHIHTVRYTIANRSNSSTVPPLVFLHGYAWGTGIFFAALPPLVSQWPGEVYALDCKGCALSSRPKWKLGYGTDCDLHEAEEWFVNPLEEWRREMKLDKMVLAGHSMGGYIATCYAEKHPDKLEGLVLVSPVGIPAGPTEEKIDERMQNSPWYFKKAMKMWDNGWSLFDVPGKWYMAGRFCQARFEDSEWANKDLLRNYLYQNLVGGNSSGGAYTHATLLKPMAYARSPLCTRIPHLKIPKLLMTYGTHDWMDWTAGDKVRARIDADQANKMDVRVLRVAKSGHNLIVDNPRGFATAVVSGWSSTFALSPGAIVGYQPSSTSAAPVKKDGTPDMRYKSNHEAAAATPV